MVCEENLKLHNLNLDSHTLLVKQVWRALAKCQRCCGIMMDSFTETLAGGFHTSHNCHTNTHRQILTISLGRKASSCLSTRRLTVPPMGVALRRETTSS